MLIFGQSSSDEHALCSNKPKSFFRTVESILSQHISLHNLENPICNGHIIIQYVCLLSQAFLPGTSLEPAVIPTAQASSFTLQYFPYYV